MEYINPTGFSDLNCPNKITQPDLTRGDYVVLYNGTTYRYTHPTIGTLPIDQM